MCKCLHTCELCVCVCDMCFAYEWELYSVASPNANHLGEAQLIAVCLVTVWKCLLSWQHLGVWLESEGEHGE